MADLEAVLQRDYVGSSFSKGAPYEPSKASSTPSLEVVLDFNQIWESILAKALEDLRPGVLAVVREPNGKRTFPDLELTTANGYRSIVEAKSARAEVAAAYDIAGRDAFYKALREGNDGYFRVSYAVGRYAEGPDAYVLTQATVSKIWELGCSDGGNRKAIRPRASALTPLSFLNEALKLQPEMVAAENERLWSSGVAMLKNLCYVKDAEVETFERTFRTFKSSL